MPFLLFIYKEDHNMKSERNKRKSEEEEKQKRIMKPDEGGGKYGGKTEVSRSRSKGQDMGSAKFGNRDGHEL